MTCCCCCCRTRGFYWNPSRKVNIWNKAKQEFSCWGKDSHLSAYGKQALMSGVLKWDPEFGFNLCGLNPFYLMRGLPAGSSLKCSWLLEALFVCQIDLRKTNLGSKSQKHWKMLQENSPWENTVSSPPPSDSCQPKVPVSAVNLLWIYCLPTSFLQTLPALLSNPIQPFRLHVEAPGNGKRLPCVSIGSSPVKTDMKML